MHVLFCEEGLTWRAVSVLEDLIHHTPTRLRDLGPLADNTPQPHKPLRSPGARFLLCERSDVACTFSAQIPDPPHACPFFALSPEPLQYVKTKRTPYAFDAKTTPNVFTNSSNIKSRVEIIPSTDGSDTCTHALDVLVNFDGVFFIGIASFAPGLFFGCTVWRTHFLAIVPARVGCAGKL